MRRLVTLSLVLLLVTPSLGAKGLRLPRGHKNPPKTTEDQIRQDEKNDAPRLEAERKKAEEADQQRKADLARKQAEADIKIAQTKLHQVEDRLWLTFTKREDVTKATATLKEAQDKYEAAYAAAVARATESPAYRQATQKRDQAEKSLAEAKAQRADLAAPQSNLLSARAAITRLESEAAAKDETVKAAKESVATAKADMDKLKKEFAEKIKEEPDYIAAVQALEEAKSKRT